MAFPRADEDFRDRSSRYRWADNRLSIWGFGPPGDLDALDIVCEVLPGIRWPDCLSFVVGDSMMEKGWEVNRSLLRDVQWIEVRVVPVLLVGAILFLAISVWGNRRGKEVSE
jgi:hypothetical protein